MLLPQGECIWKNLSTSFVDMDELLFFLKRDDFVGYLNLEFPDRQGVVFLQEGDLVNGVEQRKKERRGGKGVVTGILEQSRRESDGWITVSKLTPQTVSVLADVLCMSVIILHKGLSSDFSDLEKFVGKLRKEGFHGYIETRLSRGGQEGLIALDGGKVKAILTSDMQLVSMRENQAELDFMFSKIIEATKKSEALFDVFVAV